MPLTLRRPHRKAPRARRLACALPALLPMLCLLLAAGPAAALCLGPNCSCGLSTTSMAFGSYNPLTAPAVDSSATVRVSCTGVVSVLISYQLSLSAGSGTMSARQMASGANRLNYNLYSDTTRSTVWGDGSAGSVIQSNTLLLDLLGLAPAQVYTVYGRLAAGQRTAVPGSYSDTVTVTLTYF